jgi:hypothetical protein
MLTFTPKTNFLTHFNRIIIYHHHHHHHLFTQHALLLSIGSLVKQDRAGKETRHLEQLHDLRTVVECVKISASTATIACSPAILAKCKLWEGVLVDVPPAAFAQM